MGKVGSEKMLQINCIWEHNGADSLLYAENFIGAFTRGESLEVAENKMYAEIKSYYTIKSIGFKISKGFLSIISIHSR